MDWQESEGSINRRMNKDELIEELQEKVKELEKQKESLEKENKELKKILTVFINPHIPSSKQVFKKRSSHASKKLGAPSGHEGATRKTPKPSEIINYLLTKCPKCNDALGNPFDFEERIIEDVPEPQSVKTTKNIIPFIMNSLLIFIRKSMTLNFNLISFQISQGLIVFHKTPDLKLHTTCILFPKNIGSD